MSLARRGKAETGATVLLLAAGISLYFWFAGRNSPTWVTRMPPPYYGWQVEAWRQGHLYLPIEPQPALLTLPNPYDGTANAPYRVLDLSLYHGRYYSYFGVAPVVLLYLPWNLVSGTYPTFGFAAALFASGAFVANALVLLALRRRFFPAVPLWTAGLAIAVLAVGGLQLDLLTTPSVYEVAQTCALAGLGVCLACVYAALTSERRPTFWLAAASAAAAAAIASRPNYLPAAAAVGVAWWVRAKAKSPGGSRLSWRLTLAAGLPLAIGVGGMLLHNYARFGHPLEFGARYQLAPTDYTRVVYFSAGRILPHLGDYLVDRGRISLGGYFPFIRLAGPVVPVGLLKWLPYAWGVLGLCWVALRRDRAPPLRQWARAWLLTATGMTLLLASYFLAWRRYEIDITEPLMLGAAVGWLALGDLAGPRGRWLGRLGGLLGGATCCIGLLVGLRQLGDQPALRPLARIANYPSQLWERWRGAKYGPLHLQVKFPADRTGRKEPLVATGVDAGDIVYVHYLDPGHLALGYFHNGFGGPETVPLPVDYGRPHNLDIFMGSFVPAADATTLERWSPEALTRLRRALLLSLDGRIVMQRDVSFFDSTPDSLCVAANPRVPTVIDPSFTGRLLARSQDPLNPDLLTPTGSTWPDGLIMSVRFWPRRTERTEPLITTGVAGAGEALSVAYLPDGRIAFELDHWGQRLHVGPPLAVDFAKSHSLLVWLPSLAGRPAVPDDNFCAVVFDGQPALIVRDVAQYYPSRPDNIVFGFNAIGAGTTDTMFSGGIDAIAPAARGAVRRVLEPTPRRSGRLVLLVEFPDPDAAASEPLVVTGKNGAGDLIFVQRLNARQIRFGLDHWGAGASYGMPVEVRAGSAYRLEITMGSLWPPGHPQPPAERGHVRVSLDGRDVFAVDTSCHPAAPDQVYVGRNPIGGTSCSTTFTGQILYVDRVP